MNLYWRKEEQEQEAEMHLPGKKSMTVASKNNYGIAQLDKVTEEHIINQLQKKQYYDTSYKIHENWGI